MQLKCVSNKTPCKWRCGKLISVGVIPALFEMLILLGFTNEDLAPPVTQTLSNPKIHFFQLPQKTAIKSTAEVQLMAERCRKKLLLLRLGAFVFDAAC